METSIKKAILKSIFFSKKPAHLILHVTGKCTQRCKTCFVDFDQYKNREDLSLDEIGGIAKYLDTLVWLDISGGEPFLRKDLPEICSSFKVPAISIPTNGFDCNIISETAKRIREVTDAELCIAVSIDGFEKTNDYIRAAGSFQRAIKTLKALKEIGGIRVKVNTVLCNKNLNEIVGFMKFIKRLDVDFHSIIFQRGLQPLEEFSCPSYDKLLAIKEQIFKMWSTYGYGLRGLEEKIMRSYQKLMYGASLKIIAEKRQIPSCLAGNVHLVIYPHGDVSFCEMLSPFGNIRKGTLPELLKSRGAELQRRDIKRKNCYCHHNCNMLDNFFLNPLQYPKLLMGIWEK
jgi:MoaA/NifB/PqqE/SkfB family radical SAM enzyme